jgi:hypothetical protein
MSVFGHNQGRNRQGPAQLPFRFAFPPTESKQVSDRQVYRIGPEYLNLATVDFPEPEGPTMAVIPRGRVSSSIKLLYAPT